MKRVISVTEPGPKGSTTTSTLSGPPFGWFTWFLLSMLMVILSQDSLKPWHTPAVLAFWPLSALGWLVRERRNTRQL